jgi:hypothetical protein
MLSTAPRRGNAFPPACASSVRRLVLCRFSSAAPTAHRAVPFTTGLLETHGSVITAPTTAIRTARGGSCCCEYPRPHISMNNGHLPPFFRQFPDALTSRQFSFAFGAADPAPPSAVSDLEAYVVREDSAKQREVIDCCISAVAPSWSRQTARRGMAERYAAGPNDFLSHPPVSAQFLDLPSQLL